jgi:hypothetical protein
MNVFQQVFVRSMVRTTLGPKKEEATKAGENSISSSFICVIP